MGEFRRSRSKVWWSHFPEDEEEEMSPSVLPGWGPGVPLSPDRGSPSNGSHKSQDSGFSDSENSPPNPKPSEDLEEEKSSPIPQLPETPTARIPRVCLSRYKTTLTLDKCLNKTWSAEDCVKTNDRFNQSDCVSDLLGAEEARTSFVIESDDEQSDVKNDSEVPQDTSSESSDSTENQTAVFIPKSKWLNPAQVVPPSPITSRPCSPKCLSPTRFLKTPTSTKVASWGSELDVSGTLGAPVHCSTPKTVPSSRVQPRGSRVTRRPVNLNKNFESIAPPPATEFPPPPVQQWCRELRLLCEPECTTTLQSKSLTADLSRQVTLMAATTTEAVRTLQQRTRTISHEFTKLYRRVEQEQLEHVGPLVQSLLGHMTELLAVVELPSSSSECCGQLVAAGELLRTASSAKTLQQQQLVESVTRLGRAFTSVMDHLLAQQIKLLVAVLEEPSSNLALLSALSAFSGLGLEPGHLGDLMSRCCGIRALLGLCLDSKSASVRTASLRILATVCCSSATIRQFEQGGGVEIVTDMLSDERRGEAEVTEAVSVLAQVTAPWVEDNHTVQGLTEQLTALVAALTRLVNNTTSSVLLLLSAAALCHLSLLEPQCVWRLLDCKTAGTLLLAVRRQGPHASVFLQEQVAGLLANMAAVPEVRPHLAEHRAVVALLCFLQVRHCPLQRAPEIAAAERLQHKSAIALSRLCSDPSVAAQVVDLQGINRLVRLCKEERERNHSDGVLVACLAALRKIVANCGLEVVDQLNARELVEPRLLDSFFLYSSRQESYV
ncbi:protein inscuteable homolog [Macrosteles quadrilineatus]|uniref:protein inscuteable homolog n=1 Tax=Macrosteles quadrilineatus TaxID=74068 RepID=UPI0023E2F8C7|nr:protein inscuteable homolog [Macrosteles quadrilineatus]